MQEDAMKVWFRSQSIFFNAGSISSGPDLTEQPSAGQSPRWVSQDCVGDGVLGQVRPSTAWALFRWKTERSNSKISACNPRPPPTNDHREESLSTSP